MQPLRTVAEIVAAGGCPPFAVDLQGWHSTDPFFAALLAEVKPKVIVEVGSWKGASAIHMAKLAPTARLFCVDPWVGSFEHWVDDFAEGKGLPFDRWGFPALYPQFLANVFSCGVAHQIIPIPLPSTTGAKVLDRHGVTADLVYIDGSHEESDVAADIEAWWSRLRPGGVIFGDDVTMLPVWVAVAGSNVINKYARVLGNFWLAQRPHELAS